MKQAVIDWYTIHNPYRSGPTSSAHLRRLSLACGHTITRTMGQPIPKKTTCDKCSAPIDTTVTKA